ncbi:hypothetical protein ACFFMM_10255 [Micromonospora chaiyaphumensis]|uniref:EcsC protein family protein n=1 Tax=Micromonospora chaiyaphumensis TaxID=307119 RepID=A0A1C4XY84_9ACTN|nr:hypothetical protein [Micromonospora chaiyaphumensis]SCF13071.1 EcsC protein family protein [Micromonospora chaiyaphumensis]
MPPRPRTAPVVLFQPPDPAQATPLAAGAPATPHQRPPAETAADPGTPASVVAATDRGTPAVAPPPATAPADEAVIEEAPKRTRRAPAPKKAAPAKKRTAAAQKSAATAPVPPAEAPTSGAAAPEPGTVQPAEAATETGTPARTGRARKSATATPAKKAAAKRTPARRASATPAAVQPDVAEPALGQAADDRPAERNPAEPDPAQTPAEADPTQARAEPDRTQTPAAPDPAQTRSSQVAAVSSEDPDAAPTLARPDAASTPARPGTSQGRAELAAAEVPVGQAGQPNPTAEAEPGPANPATPPTPAREVVPVTAMQADRRVESQGWREATARVLDHPGFAPELLALAAVDALGPRAATWVQRTRDAYPDADADGLARLVTRRFVRLAGAGGALAAGAGLFAPVAELTAVLWTQANLVLHLAAVYGRDPAHPDRVVELLVLTQVHPDAATARAALDGLRSAGAPAEGSLSRAAEAAWRLATPLVAQAAGWLALRLAARLLPGAAALAAATGDTTAAERLAARATSLYRPARR